MITWGTVTTTNAPLARILDFAAWHLEQGAQRLYIYLDDTDPAAAAALSAHPNIVVRARVIDGEDSKYIDTSFQIHGRSPTAGRTPASFPGYRRDHG